jgi:hypothetical protein
MPRLRTLEQSYSTLLPSSPEFDNIRVVLGVAMQDTYNGRQTADFALPAILERKKSSIQTFTSNPNLLCDLNNVPEEGHKKRPLDIQHEQSENVSKVQRQAGMSDKLVEASKIQIIRGEQEKGREMAGKRTRTTK